MMEQVLLESEMAALTRGDKGQTIRFAGNKDNTGAGANSDGAIFS